MATCSNCYSTIKDGDEVVYSVVDKSPMHLECANKCPSCHGYLTDMQFARNKCKCVVQKKSSINLVRRSHIELYKTCPHAFYLECIKGEEQENNAYALHGIILHEIFDKYSKLEEINTEDMKEEFTVRYMQEIPADHFSFKDAPMLRDALLEKGYDAIQGFMEFQTKAGIPYITEENIMFTLDEDLPQVSITMDRLDKDENGDLHMSDYKCGKTFTGKKLSDDLQLPLYCWAVLKEHGVLPKSFTFLFVSEGKERHYDYIGDMKYKCTVRKKDYIIDVDEKIRETIDILTKIKNEQFNNMCSNFWHCNNMCYYKKKGTCDGADSKIFKVW